MKYVAWLGVASVALMAASCAPTIYNSGTSQTYDATDFNGDWQLVTGRSDIGSNWTDERTRFGADWGTTDGTLDGTSGRMRYSAWFLPDAFRIDGNHQSLRIEDKNGDIIADVPLDAGNTDNGSYQDPNDSERGVHARWISDQRFEVERVGRSGRRITQTFTLENRDRQLVVGTRVERDGGTRSYTRVYERP